MRKLLIILVLFCSCSDDTVELSKEQYRKLTGDTSYPVMLHKNVSTVVNWMDDEMKIVELDGCEWIVGYTNYSDGGPVFAHRGQCKFCKQRRKQEYEEFIKTYFTGDSLRIR